MEGFSLGHTAPTVAGQVLPSLGPPLCCVRSPGGSTGYRWHQPKAAATGPPPRPQLTVFYTDTQTCMYVRDTETVQSR